MQAAKCVWARKWLGFYLGVHRALDGGWFDKGGGRIRIGCQSGSSVDCVGLLIICGIYMVSIQRDRRMATPAPERENG